MMVQYVHSCIQGQRFVVTDHARNEHTIAEGFTVRQGIEALLRGTVIEEYSTRHRMLFCGEGHGLKLDTRFFTTYVHVVVQIEEETQIVVITMYRPKISEWKSPWKRR